MGLVCGIEIESIQELSISLSAATDAPVITTTEGGGASNEQQPPPPSPTSLTLCVDTATTCCDLIIIPFSVKGDWEDVGR